MPLFLSRLLALTALMVVYEANTVVGVAALAGGFGFVLGRYRQRERACALFENVTAGRHSR
jgi:hypothetical protein